MRLRAVVPALVVALAAACGGSGGEDAPSGGDGRLLVATTVSPITSIVAA